MTQIAVLVGSLHDNSINRHLAEALEKLAPEGVAFNYLNLEVPLFKQDLESTPPTDVVTLKEAIEAADGILVVTPEYNRGIPGVLKNAIDWASRPYGKNSFDGKPVAIAGSSTGATGTTQAQQQLRNVLIYLNTKLMGQPELYIQHSRAFNERGELDPASKELLQTFVNTFLAHVGK